MFIISTGFHLFTSQILTENPMNNNNNNHLIPARRPDLIIINKKKKRKKKKKKKENLQNCRLCCPGGPQNKSEGK